MSDIPSHGHPSEWDDYGYHDAAEAVDYKVLLKKYIEYVGECEGVDFLDYNRGYLSPDFTDEEWAALKSVSELWSSRKPE